MGKSRFIRVTAYISSCLLASVMLLQPLPSVVGIGAGSVAGIDLPAGNVTASSVVIATNDAFSEKQWALHRIMATEAWETTAGAISTVIAVLDSGIDRNHEDLIGQVIAEVNLTKSHTAGDLYGHGTHVAGIIAATANNGLGIAGLSPSCRLMNVKVADDNGFFDSMVMADGVIWAVEHGANVINISLVSTEPSREMERAVDYAWSKGVVVVAASGNYIGSRIAYPGYYASTIAVGASDSNDRIPSWSRQADWVDLVAPGMDIYSTLPGNRYGSKSGTSMAAAHVSGLAGLLFNVAGDDNGNGFVNDEIRAALESGADKIDNFKYSTGRINAAQALAVLYSDR